MAARLWNELPPIASIGRCVTQTECCGGGFDGHGSYCKFVGVLDAAEREL